ncbi:hypothetical protein NDU88_005573, partial [Pleurodeles waltl]
VYFLISRRTKCMSTSVDYPAFPHNNKLCVVKCLKVYGERPANHRSDPLGPLLIAIRKTFRPVSAATLARWVRWSMSEAGIDLSVYGAHS